MRQSAVALLDDKDLGALKAMTPHKKGHLTKARMKPIMDSSLEVLIPGSMSLLRPEWGKAVFDRTGGVDKVVETGGSGTLNQSIAAVGYDGEIAS